MSSFFNMIFLYWVNPTQSVILFLVLMGGVIYILFLRDENRIYKKGYDENINNPPIKEDNGVYLLLLAEIDKVGELTKKVKELEDEIALLKKQVIFYRDIKNKPIEGL
jgi:hypothetical protein